MMSTHCPFFATGYLQRPDLFIGRNYELTFIKHRMTASQPTSVNIYGEKRIGKSSLLYHFYLTWENRVEPEQRQQFAVIYLSVATVSTEVAFYQTLVNIWREYPPLRQNGAWQEIWQASVWTRTSFYAALQAGHERVKVLPVVCLDDIEALLKHPQEFDEGFYSNLRAAMDSSHLMLVIASFEPLHQYKQAYGLLSTFFNLGHEHELKMFGKTEVDTLLLWADQVQFSPRQKKKMRQWGENHPYRLQLAGVHLWEARENGKDERFAEVQFKQDIARKPLSPRPSQSFWRVMLLPFKGLGQLAEKAGDWWEEFHKTVYGILIVIAVILAIVYGLLFVGIKLGLIPFEFLPHILSVLFSNPPVGH